MDHQALFAVIQNKFGGDGRTNFKLPDLRGRFPIGVM
jgi:microcystin-dependent protein